MSCWRSSRPRFEQAGVGLSMAGGDREPAGDPGRRGQPAPGLHQPAGQRPQVFQPGHPGAHRGRGQRASSVTAALHRPGRGHLPPRNCPTSSTCSTGPRATASKAGPRPGPGRGGGHRQGPRRPGDGEQLKRARARYSAYCCPWCRRPSRLSGPEIDFILDAAGGQLWVSQNSHK